MFFNFTKPHYDSRASVKKNVFSHVTSGHIGLLRQIKNLYYKRIQLPPPSDWFGTSIWPTQRHVKALQLLADRKKKDKTLWKSNTKIASNFDKMVQTSFIIISKAPLDVWRTTVPVTCYNLVIVKYSTKRKKLEKLCITDVIQMLSNSYATMDFRWVNSFMLPPAVELIRLFPVENKEEALFN